ncbi:flagellar filament capping protein FliD [Vallitalea sp.]|jgi:flagellar hook-associated protein 2|uniref:flagellar filament capping protein FliD n=1 Tax=Vallitalea sp. TaxID=1882829 RepID=UPI0025E073A6|nr:flagellar filament capping protein FliD [Vallitalea sp.]MCT4686252.1 flagellar filament capping protein FliD [Vallitalea sp.]
MAVQFSGLASGLDTDNIIKELMKAERMKVDKVKKQKTKLEWRKDIWKDMNKKLYSFFTKQVHILRSKGTFMKKNAVSSNESIISAKANAKATKGTHTFTVTQLAKGSFLTGDKLDKDKDGKEITNSTKAEQLVNFTKDEKKTIGIKLGDKTVNVEITAKDTINSITNKIKEKVGDINASFDNNFKRIMMSSKEQGDGVKIEIVSGDAELIKKLGLEGKVGSNGQNAKITYNGTQLESKSNEITVNGLTVTLKSKGEANITVNQDTKAMYDNVKDFITEYNKLLVEINEKLGADRVAGYEPLTQEEKKAMSQDDIKLWEQKIKGSLLRRDDILTSLVHSMRGIVGSSIGVDTSGLDYRYLSDLGIVTGDHNERGLLHINGDGDDPLYASKTNKLKEAIEKDPEKVAALLNKIGEKLYSKMQKKMKSTEISSAFTFFNDKQMDKQIDDYEDRITVLEDKLANIEKRYYRQFTAMEKAIQMMNNQSASLASMLGGGAQ